MAPLTHHLTALTTLTTFSCLLILLSIVSTLVSIHSLSWVHDTNSMAFQYRIGLREWELLYYYDDARVFTLPNNDNGRWQSYLGNILQYYNSGQLVYFMGWLCAVMDVVSMCSVVLSLTSWKHHSKLYHAHQRHRYTQLQGDSNRSVYQATANGGDGAKSSEITDQKLVGESTAGSDVTRPPQAVTSEHTQIRDLLLHLPLFLSGMLTIVAICIYENLRPSWRGAVKYGWCYGLFIGSGMMSQTAALMLWHLQR